MEPKTDAVSRALALPHVVETICKYLSRECLATTAQVDWHFFQYVTDRLWGHTRMSYRSLSLLQRHVAGSSRWQLYASKLRELTIKGRWPRARHLMFHCHQIRFDRVKRLCIEKYTAGTTLSGAASHAMLGCYITPDIIQSLEFGERSIVDDSLFRFLTVRCGRLRELRMDYPWPADAPALAQLVAACPMLERITCISFRQDRPGSKVIEPAFLVECAHLSRLERLFLPWDAEMPAEAFQMIDSQVSHPFSRLRELRIIVPSVSVPLLSNLATSSSSLNLANEDRAWAACEWFSQIETLENLTIHVPSRSNIPEFRLRPLGRLSALNCLQIYSGTKDAAILQLSAAEFATWVSHFPKLTSLNLQVGVGASEYDAALVALGQHCPLLSNLSWPAQINLSALQLDWRKGRLFPRLEWLDCPSAVTSPRDDEFPR